MTFSGKGINLQNETGDEFWKQQRIAWNIADIINQQEGIDTTA